MPDDELLRWYKEQLERGLSKSELVQVLHEFGYTENDISELISTANGKSPIAEKPPMAPRPEAITKSPKPWERIVQSLDEVEGKARGKEIVLQPAEKQAPPKKKARKVATVEEISELPQLAPPIVGGGKDGKRYREVGSRFPKRTPLNELVSRESSFFWKAVLLAIVFIIALVGFFLLLIFKPPELVGGGGDTGPYMVDNIPPLVSIAENQGEWMTTDGIELECVDSGVDFSSGCDNESYAFMFSSEESCPKDYSLYLPVFPEKVGSGFLCVTAKDNDGNAGFSKPLTAKFDTVPPETQDNTTEGLEDRLLVSLSDIDAGSGLSECFYSIESKGNIVQGWTPRPCNSVVELPIGPGGCNAKGEGACVLKAYATDKAGNKGITLEVSYNID